MQQLLFSRILLTGPPGSGKTHRVLERLLGELERGNAEHTLLVVPTASFREHTRNTVLRRTRLPSFSDRTIVTFADLTGDLDARLSPARRQLLVERLLREMDLPYLRAVQDYQGFRDALSEEAEEFLAAGCRPEAIRPGRPPRLRHIAFQEFVRRYEAATASFRQPSAPLKKPQVLLVDGFTDFTADQQRTLGELLPDCAHAMVTLPEGCDKPAAWLVEQLGFLPEKLEGNRRGTPRRQHFHAPSRYEEVESLAAQILRLVVEQGYQYREIGVILENREVYAPLIADQFRRRRIPVRLYFPLTTRSTAMGRHLLACLDLLRASPESLPDAVLAVLKSPYSPVASRDVVSRFEYDVTARRYQAEQGQWDACLGSRPDPALRDFLTDLRRLRVPGASVADLWTTFTVPAEIPPGISHEHALELRADSAVWREAVQLLSEIGDAAKAEGISLDSNAFLSLLQSELGRRRFHVRDRRVDAVNVMNPYEARQWELRAVFLLGLVETEFPPAAQPRLFLDDAQRQALGLATLDQRREEQRRLVEVAATRARELLVCSSPLRDEHGNALLPALFLAESRTEPVEQPEILWEEAPPAPAERSAHLDLPAVITRVREREVKFSASRFRNFGHCAFQHFGRNMLHLKGEPKEAEGLDPLLQGTIIHATLFDWETSQRRADIEAVFTKCFAEMTTGLPIRHGEQRLRARMLQDLKRFVESERNSVYRTEVDRKLLEKSFGPGRQTEDLPLLQWTLDDGSTITLTGRLDRVETAPNEGRPLGLVVDFKYSKNGYNKKRLEEVGSGQEFQIPLYLLALRDVLGLTPAGAELYTLRGEPRRSGVINEALAIKVFHGQPPATGSILPRDQFRDLLETGKNWMRRYATAIRNGEIAVQPIDSKQCKKAGCEFYDVCRVDKWRLPQA